MNKIFVVLAISCILLNGEEALRASCGKDNNKFVVICEEKKLGKLMWEDEKEIFKGTWGEAKHYCENLNLAGYNDWRLPTRLELLSITDDSRITPINRAFKNISKESIYWSLTKYVGNQSNVWAVDFWDGHGHAASNIVSDKACVRCVRND
jgi:hypothetical protein|nr:DUF1566 domain-containing protein [uncultured Campylobacter sp.]